MAGYASTASMHYSFYTKTICPRLPLHCHELNKTSYFLNSFCKLCFSILKCNLSCYWENKMLSGSTWADIPSQQKTNLNQRLKIFIFHIQHRSHHAQCFCTKTSALIWTMLLKRLPELFNNSKLINIFWLIRLTVQAHQVWQVVCNNGVQIT